MHLYSILHVFGTLFLVTGFSMILPLGCALIYGEGDAGAICTSMLLILVIAGAACAAQARRNRRGLPPSPILKYPPPGEEPGPTRSISIDTAIACLYTDSP